MSKPYYLVCYGHVMRISLRCDTSDEALRYCFGTGFDKGVTVERREGPGWAYISQKNKRGIILALAQKHYDRTGSVLSGCEKDITKKPKAKVKDESSIPAGWHAAGDITERGIFPDPPPAKAGGDVHEAKRGRGEGE